MFKKILIANRGEIALRVLRACAELDIPAVAVYSDADRDALHVRGAAEAYRLGPAPAAQSYLNIDRLLEVAAAAGADALHPGYGFLAENAAFARRCASAGVTFIGPSPAVIDRMGGKIAARKAARAAGMPIVPGTTKPLASADEARAAAKKLGYPVAVKASAGGGGKGLRVAHSPAEIESAFALASKEALNYFKDATVYLERYLARPKHVEVQVLGDKHGNVVHLGERDCSMQRRHQKLVEETPATIGSRTRRRLHEAAVRLAASIGYDSAGTIECLVDGDEFFFLEMNTRIQVEHTITEAVYGVDLVKAQIRVAAGEALWLAQRDLRPRGHAIECRINAESPAHDFRPSAGTLTAYAPPGGPGVRVDGAGYPGWTIPREYDSLIAKLVTWGEGRDEARHRMLRALGEFRIEGVDTTAPFLRALLQDAPFVSGAYATVDVDAFLRTNRAALSSDGVTSPQPESEAGTPGQTVVVEVNEKRFEVRVFGLDAPPPATTSSPRTRRFAAPKRIAGGERSVVAPMHGILAEIRVAAGDSVSDGQVVAIIEAMKMMNEVVAHRAGTVASIDARVGETVETGAPILTFSV